MSATKVLLVDDEPGVRFGIRDFLESHGFEVEEAENCAKTKDAFIKVRPDVAVIDYKLPDGNTIDLLPSLRTIDPDVPIIILTGHGSIDLAVRAIKEGAEQFLTKPVELPALLVIIERLVEHRRMRQKQAAGQSRQKRTSINPFQGASPSIVRLAVDAKRILASDSPILIHGETGTGKGVLAQWLHDNGRRSEEAFVDLNCAGLNREFLETELFGHERGAFTGAVSSKTGLLDVAHRGTLFLDEIGDMETAVQPKLLKVLEDQSFRRLGSVRDRRVDVHLIAASHHDLGALVDDGSFRKDLFYRLNTIPLVVPPLRDRQEDIPVLARQFLAAVASDIGRPDAILSESAERALQAYGWPGNIRELRNVVERAVLLAERDMIEADDLRFDQPAREGGSIGDVNLSLLDVERLHLEGVLGRMDWKVAKAADVLGVPKSSLYQKIKKFDLVSPTGRSVE
ncbi:MAG: sigma-54 dependent transcriptional regulator [Gemmatimonadota bacterium]|nr:sigma-54 dependent transcriptional regulator [Gemmatimonadota bacterium]